MRISRFHPAFLILAALIISTIACSNGGSPITPDVGATQELPIASLTGNSNRSLLAFYDAVIDPINQTFTITPNGRELFYHGALTRLFAECLTITDYGWSPNFWVDITIIHPLPDSGWIVFDPRVIAILPADPGVSFNYPILDCVGNNSVLNPDGYTKLHDELGGSIPGNTNPFKAYFKDQPNRRWMDRGVTSEIQRWEMDLSGLPIPFEYKLVVDISTNYPQLPTPIVDNAPEPVQIEAIVGEGLTSEGGEAQIEVTLLDWQGRMSIGGVKVEAPDLFNGTVNLAYSEPGPNPHEYVYKGAFVNSLHSPVGEYKILVVTWDQMTEIYTYNEFPINVSEPPPPSGNLIWAKSAGGESYEYGSAITSLSDNSSVVTGAFKSSTTFGPGEINETILHSMGANDIFVAKYNPDGTLEWAKRAGGVDTQGDEGLGITTLSDNSTVVTGYFWHAATFGPTEPNQTVLTSIDSDDIFIARYNPDGTLAWAKQAGGEAWSERGCGITTLSDDSIVVTGYFSGSATFGQGETNETVLTSSGAADVFIARYHSDGTLVWAKRAGGTRNDKGNGITTLSDNSTVVSGCFGDSATFGTGEDNETVLTCAANMEIFVACYNPDGTLKWAKQSYGYGYTKAAYNVTSLSDNSAVVTGYFDLPSVTFGPGEPNETTLTTFGDADIFIACYNPDGTLAWAKSAGGYETDRGMGITSLSDNSIVVTGHYYWEATFGSGEVNETILFCAGKMDIFFARYRSDGTLIWAKCAGGLEGYYYSEVGISITTLPDNSTVATGSYVGPATFGMGESNQTVLNPFGVGDFFVARFEP